MASSLHPTTLQTLFNVLHLQIHKDTYSGGANKENFEQMARMRFLICVFICSYVCRHGGSDNFKADDIVFRRNVINNATFGQRVEVLNFRL